MKRNRRKWMMGVIAGLLCFVSAHLFAADSSKNEAAYLEKYRSILETMKTSMSSTPRTGDPALDYLNQMIPHHETAVKMAENEIQYGTNQQVKRIAEKQIKDQTAEIAEMKKMADKIKANPKSDKAQEAAYMNDYVQFHDAMVSAMEDVKSSGNVDKDFLMQMMPHHDGAINMSRAISRYTNNSEVKQKAQSIIKKQTQDMKKMQVLIKHLP